MLLFMSSHMSMSHWSLAFNQTFSDAKACNKHKGEKENQYENVLYSKTCARFHNKKMCSKKVPVTK